ncbi:MAG TPA: nucleotide-binding protein [Thermoanaerobaculia bacterium]|jgi:predicted nucleotide-binding protein|nr:nucleotide-binding protein [Thermoanaerobaculia bacterium]
MEPDTAGDLLRRQIENGEQLLANRPVSKGAFSSWLVAARGCVEWIYGTDSDSFRTYTASPGIVSVPLNPSEAEMQERRADTIEDHLAKLTGLLDIHVAKKTAMPTRHAGSPGAAHATRIFIVHGHNHESRLETARLLEHLGLHPIILQEQVNAGRTLIEKFEDSATASGFAVILLTPDDRGRPATARRSCQRARQNVIFELGYLIAKLGRSRVCALYVPGVELPSDLLGFAHVELDVAGAWKTALAKELQAAGVQINAAGLTQ